MSAPTLARPAHGMRLRTDDEARAFLHQVGVSTTGMTALQALETAMALGVVWCADDSTLQAHLDALADRFRDAARHLRIPSMLDRRESGGAA